MNYYMYVNKFNQGSKVYYNLLECGPNAEKTVERDILKNAIINRQVEVLNLQIAVDGRLVDRNYSDSSLGKYWVGQLTKLMNLIRDNYKKQFGNQVSVVIEPISGLVPYVQGFLLGYSFSISYKNNMCLCDIYASAHGNDVFIFGKSHELEIINSDLNVVYNQLMSFINDVIFNNSSDILNIMFKEITLDKEKGIIYPKYVQLSGNDNLVLEARNEFGRYFKEVALGCYQLLNQKGSLTFILNYAIKHGKLKPSVENSSSSKLSGIYDSELTKYWNKKSSLLSSDCIIYHNNHKSGKMITSDQLLAFGNDLAEKLSAKYNADYASGLVGDEDEDYAIEIWGRYLGVHLEFINNNNKFAVYTVYEDGEDGDFENGYENTYSADVNVSKVYNDIVSYYKHMENIWVY